MNTTVEFHFRASGASAGINSTEFYTCGECGAAVVEMDRSDWARQRHTTWHRVQAAAGRPLEDS